MRPFVLAAALLLLVPSFAMARDFQTVTFGQRVLSTGDGIGRVLEVAGQPSRVVQLENSRGAAIGERWEYYTGSKTVLITIQGGVITQIVETR